MDSTKAAAEKLALELEAFRATTRRVEDAQIELLNRLTEASAKERQWLREKYQLQKEMASLRRQVGLSRARDLSPERIDQLDSDTRPCSPVASLVSDISTTSTNTKLNSSPRVLDESNSSLRLIDESENSMSSIAAVSPPSSTLFSNEGTKMGKDILQNGFLIVKGLGLESNSRKIQFCSSISQTNSTSPVSKRDRALFESQNQDDEHGQSEDNAICRERLSPPPTEITEILPSRPYKQRKAKDYALAAMIWSSSVFRSQTTDKNNRLESKQQKIINHALYGQGFCQRWIDVKGRCRLTFGVMRARCESNGICPLYEVEYQTEPLDDAAAEAQSSNTPYVGLVPEKVAWGGYFTYLQLVMAKVSNDESVPFHVAWLQPTIWMIDTEERLIIEVRGFLLVFTVAPSRIAGAGLGLYVCVTERTFENRQYLHLKCGEMIGLGRYAPLGESDGKSETIFLMKNFIHEFEPSVYAFQAKRSGCEVFDLTDDTTGTLHEKAEVSHLIRVNETDGIECPSVVAEYDPSGGIQYNLGHGESGQGDLKIPVDEPFELKLDYSEAYETIRVMQNYPRVNGKELEAIQQTIYDRDRSALSDFSMFDPMEIDDCISFLEVLFDPATKTNPVQLQRTLVVALTLRNRVEVLKKEGDVDDVKHLSTNRIVTRVRSVIRFICIGIGGVSQLKDAISDLPILKDAFVEYIGLLSHDDLESTDFTSLLSTLWELPEGD